MESNLSEQSWYCCLTGPKVTMHVSRGLQRSLPAGREKEGCCYRSGNLSSRVKPAGNHCFLFPRYERSTKLKWH